MVSMNQELKDELKKMMKHTDKWIDEAMGFNQKVNVRRCLENAKNGVIRSIELLED